MSCHTRERVRAGDRAARRSSCAASRARSPRRSPSCATAPGDGRRAASVAQLERRAVRLRAIACEASSPVRPRHHRVDREASDQSAGRAASPPPRRRPSNGTTAAGPARPRGPGGARAGVGPGARAAAGRRAPDRSKSASSLRRGRRASRRATARRARTGAGRSSIASITPSARPGDGAQADAELVDRLVVEGVDLDGRAAARRRAESGATRTSCVTRAGLAWRCSIVPSVMSGRCWCSVPPRATLSSWAPRQMPRIGSPRASAWRQSASSNASSRGSVGPSSGCGAAP